VHQKSTHLPEKFGGEELWTIDLFKRELDNLLRHLGLQGRPIDVYGHSWSGMLAVEWAAALPDLNPNINLRRLVISNNLASMDVWRFCITALRKKLPADVQDVLDQAEITKDFESPDYEAAVEVFYKRHVT
jgi:pimeloyl-ACP methyl ester carboxylesterase